MNYYQYAWANTVVQKLSDKIFIFSWIRNFLKIFLPWLFPYHAIHMVIYFSQQKRTRRLYTYWLLHIRIAVLTFLILFFYVGCSITSACLHVYAESQWQNMEKRCCIRGHHCYQLIWTTTMYVSHLMWWMAICSSCRKAEMTLWLDTCQRKYLECAAYS